MQFKNLTNQEKGYIAFILILLLAIALSWGRISSGIKQGVEPYFKENKK